MDFRAAADFRAAVYTLGPLRSGYTSLKLPDRALHHHIETVTAEAGFAAEHPHSLPGFKQPRGEGVANVNSRGIPSSPLLQVFFMFFYFVGDVSF